MDNWAYVENLLAQIANDNGWQFFEGKLMSPWVWNEDTDKIVAYHPHLSDPWVGWKRGGAVVPVGGEVGIERYLRC